MKSIIITGGNSGIGFECTMQAARISPNEQIIIACRNRQAGTEAIAKIKGRTGHKHLLFMPLDLSSLQSIRDFKAELSKQNGVCISALMNNAGIQNISDTQTTKDGFERTFGVNHLGPFYLTLLLLPLMDTAASITFTASDTHDPLQKTGIENAVYTSARKLAYPEQTAEKRITVGQRRYSTSKLCNVMTAYEFQRRLAHTDIRVNAFDPGMVPGTGLAQTYPPVLKFVWNNLMPILTFFKHNTNCAKKSGTRLANLALAKEYKGIKGKYFSDGKVMNSSADSYNPSYQQDLWRTSVELVGIQQSETRVAIG